MTDADGRVRVGPLFPDVEYQVYWVIGPGTRRNPFYGVIKAGEADREFQSTMDETPQERLARMRRIR